MRFRPGNGTEFYAIQIVAHKMGEIRPGQCFVGSLPVVALGNIHSPDIRAVDGFFGLVFNFNQQFLLPAG